MALKSLGSKLAAGASSQATTPAYLIYPGAASGCPLRSFIVCQLPQYSSCAGPRSVRFEDCSAFTCVAACTLARSPIRDPRHDACPETGAGAVRVRHAQSCQRVLPSSFFYRSDAVNYQSRWAIDFGVLRDRLRHAWCAVTIDKIARTIELENVAASDRDRRHFLFLFASRRLYGLLLKLKLHARQASTPAWYRRPPKKEGGAERAWSMRCPRSPRLLP